MTPEELPAYLTRLRDKVAKEGPRASAYAMARAFHTVVVDETLTRYSHGRGERTDSPPGQPPASVSGALRRSVRLYPAVSTGAYSAQSSVVPLIIYARIQELGGVVVARHTYTGKDGKTHPGFLAWNTGGKMHFARSVRIPPRPYMRPTHKQVIADGRLRKASIDTLKKLVP